MKLRYLLLFSLLLLLAGCKKEEAPSIVFSGDSVSTTSKNVTVDGTTVTITDAGTYEISGSAEEGQIVVNVTNGKAVYLNLNGLELRCSTDAPIRIVESSMTVINLIAHTQNIITDDHPYSELLGQQENGTDTVFESAPDAAIYSKSPLLILGADTGKLVVNGNSYNGISSSDTLTVEGGNLTINAEHHAIKGRDYVVISGGVLNLKCGRDGVKATNAEDAALGYVNITGGTVNINADDDGIYAPRSITVSGGNLVVKAHNIGLKTEGALDLRGGIIDVNTNDEVMVCKTKTIGAAVILTVNGKAYKEE